MSYEDLEAGFIPKRGDFMNGHQDPTHALKSGVFQINTEVSTYAKLTNQLGSGRDTSELRKKMQAKRQHISQLIKETSAKLKAVTEKDRTRPVSADRKVEDAKLAKDFQTVLQLFERAQKVCAEREKAYASLVSQPLVPESYTAGSSDDEQRNLLTEQKRQEFVQLDNEITFNEAVIEERAQGIREVHEQIEEVHEIFKDLATMVHQQGGVIEEIDSNVENTYSATATANKQLAKASKSQKSGNTLGCLLIVIFTVALVIVIIVLAA